MTRAPTDTELRAAEAAHTAFREMGWLAPRWSALGEKDRRRFLGLAAVIIRSLRDAPHALLDQARGNRLASGDAAVFWNNMIDAISPPEGT